MSKVDLQKKMLKVIILSQLCIEANDDISNSNMYKGKMKIFGRQYINQLGTAIKQTHEVYKANPTIFTNLLNNIDELVTKIADADPKGLVMINQIHEHYKNNMEDWDNMFSVELQNLKDKN